MYDISVRDAKGIGNNRYINTSGRNDFKVCKVTHDNDNIYFYVRTVDDLTPHTDPAWMRLFLDTQRATETSVDWEEFEYVINRRTPSDSVAYLERSKGGWDWEQVGEVRYSVNGNVLQIEVPREMLGFKNKPINFNFKWSDNMQEDGDIMDFYLNGDVAPGGRLCFAFRDKAAYLEEKGDEKEGFSISTTAAIIIASSIVLVGVIAAGVIILVNKKSV